MTQENNAADRAQEFNDVSVETTAASNESFAQDWLDAEEKERVGETDATSRPRFIATLPDWTVWGKTNDEKKRRGDWREILRNGKLRTTGVALAAFGLGVLCASGIWNDEKSEKNDLDVAAVDRTLDAEDDVLLENGIGETNDASLASIDSSTLRSVPNPADVDFLSRSFDGADAATENAVVSDVWGDANVWGNNGVEANVNGRANGEVATAADAGGFADLTSTQTAAPNAVGNGDSNWRRGVDFQRDVETPSVATANVDRFPTWDDLGANVPTVADVLNSPLETPSPSVAASSNDVVANNYYTSENNWGVAQNAAVAANPSVGENADYAAYNGNAGYRQADAANLNGDVPQFAGNSQNSGYNQTDGSENFAGWPTSVPTANYVADASVAPTASSAPTANYVAVASVAPTSSSVPTANYVADASVAPTASSVPTPNYVAVAPVAPTASSVPTPNYVAVAPVAPTASSVPTPNYAGSTTAPRAMVARVPSENAPVAAPNAPVANPNLRW